MIGTKATFYKGDKMRGVEPFFSIDVCNPEIIRIIRSHIRTDASAALSTDDPKLAEDLIHLYNELTTVLDEAAKADQEDAEDGE